MSKSLDSVFFPHKFIPQIIMQNMTMNQLWQENQALLFSSLSHIAYFDEAQITAFTKQLGADNCYCYNHKGAQAFLSIWQDKAVLAFRGTQPLERNNHKLPKSGLWQRLRIKLFHGFSFEPHLLTFFSNDIFADLNFLPADFDNLKKTKVHRGFLQEINKLWPQIEADLKKLTNIPVWVTGHSLGAAMSTLAAMRFPFESAITFGEPRVGSQIEKSFITKNHLRYKNGKDPVTTVPPEFIYDYKHHGQEIKIAVKDGEEDMRYDHSIVFYSENLLK